MNNQPKVIMTIGVPGSGKSTYANGLKSLFKIVSLDTLVENRAKELKTTYSEIYSSHPEIIKELSNDEISIVNDLVSKNESFIWDRTHLNKTTRAKRFEHIPKHYLKIGTVFNQYSLSELVERCENRQRRTGKVIPESLISSMLMQFEYPTMDEGFDRILEIKY